MNKRKIDEGKRVQCDAMLVQFYPVKTIATALRMGRGTISERAKRNGLARHYISDEEVRHLLKRRLGGGRK